MPMTGDPRDTERLSLTNGTNTKALPGQLGSLTPEQEDTLRELWKAFFNLHSTRDDATPESVARDGGGIAELEIASQERGLEVAQDTPQPYSASSGVSSRNGLNIDDKCGLTKEHQGDVESCTPQEVRDAFWLMLKHDHPDSLMLRFLRARQWDVEKALSMLVSTLNWRYFEMRVDHDILGNGEAGALAAERNGHGEAKRIGHDFLQQCRLGKSFLHGLDKDGRPLCVVRVRLHKSNEHSKESLERYTVFIIETARLTLTPPIEAASIIFDMTGFTLANMDYQPVKFMIHCFEANYPESLGVVLVHNAPWVFKGIWRVIQNWLDPVVASKIHFTNQRTGLEEFINAENIIADLGGDEDWKYEYEEPISGENDLMSDTKTRDTLLNHREGLFAQFEANTRRWIAHSSGVLPKQIKVERSKIAAELRTSYWQLDPYVRARSLYDRQGVIHRYGNVDWYRRGRFSRLLRKICRFVHGKAGPSPFLHQFYA